MLKDGARGKGDFPHPVQRISGQSPLWDWAEVAQWLEGCGRIAADSGLVANASELNSRNLALRIRAGGEQASVAERLYLPERPEEQLLAEA